MITDIDLLADEVHENAKQKGFHNTNEPIDVFVANQCNNIHAEVTELWDSFRAGTNMQPCDKAAQMGTNGLMIRLNQQEEELADIIIRALDVSRRLGVDIVTAINAKHEYNKTRPFKHNKRN